MSKNSSSLNKNYGGYEHKIFVKPVNMDLICAICSRNNTYKIINIYYIL